METEIHSLRLRKTPFRVVGKKKLFRDLVTFCRKEKIPIVTTKKYLPTDTGIHIRKKYSDSNFTDIWNYLYKNKKYNSLQNFIMFIILHGHKYDLISHKRIEELFQIKYEHFALIVKLDCEKDLINDFIDEFIKHGKNSLIMIELINILKPKWEEINNLIRELTIDYFDVQDKKISIGKIYERFEKLKNITS